MELDIINVDNLQAEIVELQEKLSRIEVSRMKKIIPEMEAAKKIYRLSDKIWKRKNILRDMP